jgi:hypothetical protein
VGGRDSNSITFLLPSGLAGGQIGLHLILELRRVIRITYLPDKTITRRRAAPLIDRCLHVYTYPRHVSTRCMWRWWGQPQQRDQARCTSLACLPNQSLMSLLTWLPSSLSVSITFRIPRKASAISSCKLIRRSPPPPRVLQHSSV